ncbi:SDR family NAD(P)-dependent oxidoreductase, partial [Streptomyces sp. NPDC059455]|uniref:SDR family NAD(P)-dependent oxidoreductase n=1 Tax=Streptomyces sp. NPDC059455 TaxID=3346837 RepID=UPI0036B9E1DD
VAADNTTVEGARALADQVPATDILINNLGIFQPMPFLDIDDDEWRRYFDVNVLSGIRLSRFYLPGMIDNGWGRVVFVSSESALQIPPEMVHYGTTKTAQLAVARGMAELCAGTGVTVNSVLPGPTKSEGVTDFVAELSGDDTGKSPEELVDEFVREHRPTSLLRRASTTEEIANMIVYLGSAQSSATTGACLSVDGGTRRSVV